MSQLALRAVGLPGALALVGLELAGELVEAHGTEDALGEEALDEGHKGVLAHRQPLPVALDLVGGDLAVGAAVVAGRVGVVLALALVHGEGLVPRGAADHPGQQVGGLAPLTASCGPSVLAEALLGGGEQLVGDQGEVLDLGDDPFLLGAQAGGPAGFALGREVEAVPDQPSRVGGVLEDRADSALGPVAAGVALGVDTAVVLERMLVGVSARRYARIGEPVGADVDDIARSTSKSAVSRESSRARAET